MPFEQPELPAAVFTYFGILAAFALGAWLTDVADCPVAIIIALGVIIGVLLGHWLF